MLLAVDIGNTTTVAGVFAVDSAPGVDPGARWTWQTGDRTTSDDLAVTVAQMLELDGIALGDITVLAISSVVPPLTDAWRSFSAQRLVGATLLEVAPGLRTGLRIATSEPSEVGADRIVNAVAAWERYGTACIVIDLGTATTFDVVDPTGAYVGGAIAPGIVVATEALVARAARLARVELTIPENVIGRTTAASMRSGILLGAVAQLEGMLTRIRAELVRDHGVEPEAHVPAIATGGLAAVLEGHVAGLDDIDADLTLRGLQLLALHR